MTRTTDTELLSCIKYVAGKMTSSSSTSGSGMNSIFHNVNYGSQQPNAQICAKKRNFPDSFKAN